MTPSLRVSGLARSFDLGRGLFGRPRARLRAVNPVDFEVMPGETLGIVGESGSGKSTLARMLVGLLPASAGTIEIEGQRLARADPAAIARKIQYVFQDAPSSLNPRKTIRQIIAAPLRSLHLSLIHI